MMFLIIRTSVLINIFMLSLCPSLLQKIYLFLINPTELKLLNILIKKVSFSNTSLYIASHTLLNYCSTEKIKLFSFSNKISL